MTAANQIRTFVPGAWVSVKHRLTELGLVQVTALRHLEDLELRDCFVLPDVSLDRKCLPPGLGGLPLTRLVLAPFAFNSDARQTNPLAELRGLSNLRELALERCQVLNHGLSSCCMPLARSVRHLFTCSGCCVTGE